MKGHEDDGMFFEKIGSPSQLKARRFPIDP
jgi:hypothetical protein